MLGPTAWSETTPVNGVGALIAYANEQGVVELAIGEVVAEPMTTEMP